MSSALGGSTPKYSVGGWPSPVVTYVQLANSWIIINVGGGPTETSPRSPWRPRPPDRVSSFLNIRVQDISQAPRMERPRCSNPDTAETASVRSPLLLRDPDGHLIEVGQTTDPRGTGRRGPFTSLETPDRIEPPQRGGHPMRSDIRPGGVFPDYSLPDHTGTVRKLSELRARPVDPHARPWQLLPEGAPAAPGAGRQLFKVAVAYTQIVTISTDDHHTLQEFRASVGAQWTFLSDPAGPSRRTSTSRSTPTPSTTR